MVLPKGVQDEIEHPNTPMATKLNMDGIYTIEVGLNSEETARRGKIKELLRGHASGSKHASDADHIFEASKYGGRYFITHDQRILGKRQELAKIIGDELQILTLRDFVEICKSFGLIA